MPPTTHSPIADQAAGEREAFLKWSDTSGFWNDAITGKAWTAACKWQREQLTAPTTGSAPETDDTFIAGYKVGARLCGTVAEAQKAIIQGHGSSWEPLYRKNHPKPASPAASVLTDEQIDEVFEPFRDAITHTGGRKYGFARAIESRVIALLAASMGGDRK